MRMTLNGAKQQTMPKCCASTYKRENRTPHLLSADQFLEIRDLSGSEQAHNKHISQFLFTYPRTLALIELFLRHLYNIE